MLFVSIARPEFIPHSSVAIELRLDLFPQIDLESIKNLIQNTTVMLTLRRTAQRTESEREALIERLLDLEPPFFDLESDMRPQFLHAAIKKYPKTEFVLSYHNFEGIPADLDQIYREMAKYEAFSYKIAVMVHSTNEAVRMLLFAKKHPKTSMICMGESGSFARALGPVVGNLVDYAAVDAQERTGPGQLTAEELMDIYHYPSLNRETAIYGLIGDPVEKSPGHIYHNGVFQKRGLNAVYVKMGVKPEELAEFIALAKEIGIRGLSVTIPLKEKILPCIDGPAGPIGAINTLRFHNGQITGTNTDGRGALDAIEKKIPVRGKKVVLLGAGGAARGIAFEAKARGAHVLVLNRTVQKAKELGYEAGGLDEVPDDYDILINCSPMSIDPGTIRPKTVAMDVVYAPRETEFLKAADAKGCQIVYGEEMFLNQAALQTAFWVGV